MTKKLFCFGVGFSGLEILKQAKANGFDVSGCVRSPEKCDHLKQQTGLNIVTIDNVDLTGCTHIITTVPTNDFDDFIYDGFAGVIKSLSTLEWFGYISTTGVYGNTDGQWVDENSPLNPTGFRAEQRVAVEKLWLDNIPQTHVFRLPGIYGSGRSALDAVRQTGARAIRKQGQIFSRIHIYDIAQAVIASMNNINAGSVYNVVDNEPCANLDVMEYACQLLKMEMVPIIDFENAEMSEMARSFYMDSRRVSNKKMKNELKVNLKYPTYREGLGAILRENK